MTRRMIKVTAIVLITPTLLGSCGLVSPRRSAEEARAAQAVREDDVLELLRVSLLTTMDLKELKGFHKEQVVIHSDYSPEPDVLREHGMSSIEMARRLAADLRFAAKPRSEAISCPAVVIPHPLPGSEIHSCRLTYDGVYYSLGVVKLIKDTAKVAVHFMFGRGFGTHVLELKRTRSGWKVVGTSRIYS